MVISALLFVHHCLTTAVSLKYHSKALDQTIVSWRSARLHEAASGDASMVMKKNEVKEFKNMLVGLRSRLRGDVSALADAALRKTRSEASGDLSSMPIHMADVGSDAFEQEFTLSLMEHDGSALEQIEAARVRIEDGLYGVCVECEGKIPKARLEVLPHTPYCVKCAEKVVSR